MSESLWVDELHSSWVVAEGWNSIRQRAWAGNQSPGFFWLLAGTRACLDGLPLRPEWVLRLPSILCWWLVVGLCLYRCWQQPRGDVENHRGRMRCVVSALLIWLVLDRGQLFYATEARVYSLLQLLSFAGWMSVLRVTDRDLRSTAPAIGAWVLIAMTLVYLHLLSGLVVVTQWLVAAACLCWRRALRDRLRGWCLAGGCVAVAAGLALRGAAAIWDRRELWSSFADSDSPLDLLWIFPLVPLLVPLLIARCVDRLMVRSPTPGRLTIPREWMWWLAYAVPLLLAWLVTVSGIAPIFHSRYLIASSLPLFLVTAMQLARLRSWLLQVIAAISIAACLVVMQGTWTMWRHGYWIGPLRGEGWRQAVAWVDRDYQPGDELWCAAGLIEAFEADLPLGPRQNEYLSFPLRGIYRVAEDAPQQPPIRALIHLNRAPEQLTAFSGERPRRCWLVYRGRMPQLQGWLATWQLTADERNRITVVATREFGRVSAALLELNSQE